MKKPPAMPQMASFEELGIMSMMPGIQYAIEHLENMLDEMRAKLDAMRRGLPLSQPDTRADGLGLIPVAIEGPLIKSKAKAAWTPERREAQAEIMRQRYAAKAQKKRKIGADDVPMEVDGKLTRYGLAKEFDISPSNVWFRLKKAGIKGQKIKHPIKRGSMLIVYSASEAQKARKLFGKPQNRGGAGSPKHPSNPDHPGHEAWIKKMSEASRKSHEVRKQKAMEAAA